MAVWVGPWTEPRPGHHCCFNGTWSYWDVCEGKKKKVPFQVVIKLRYNRNRVLVGTTKCCRPRWQFVPCILSNSKETFFPVEIRAYEEEQSSWGLCLLLFSLRPSLPPATPFLVNGGCCQSCCGCGKCSQRAYFRNNSPYINIVSGGAD